MIRVTRISPWSVGKVCFFVFFLLSFVYTLFLFLFKTLYFSGSGADEFERSAVNFTLAAAPFFNSFIGAIAGVLGAWFYNITIKYTGGLVFETEEKRGFSSISDHS